MCLLAGLAVGTETSEIKFAEGFADVFFRAVGTEGAEAFFVVWTLGEFGVGVNVEV
jgi:hypothetical protein